jgi:hsp70-interacting protein
VILDKEKSLDIRLANFDELELLVESVDNAMDLQALGMWPILLSILEKEEESELRMYAAWVMATATQNNPKAQEAFERASGIPIVLKALDQDPEESVRLKSLYCLSGIFIYSFRFLIYVIIAAIRLNPKTFTTFVESNGFQVCSNACKQGEPALLKRSLFLLSSLLQPQDDGALEVAGQSGSVADTTLEAILEHGLIDMSIDFLGNPEQLPLDDSLSFLLSVSLFNPKPLEQYKAVLAMKLLTIVDLQNDMDQDLKSKVDQLRQNLKL